MRSYDAQAAHVWARQGLGRTTLIPLRQGRPRQDNGPPGGYWRRRMVRWLDSKAHRRQHGYTQRSQAETTNSMMKRNLASALAGQTAWSRKRDLMLKALTHNLMILNSGGLRQSPCCPFLSLASSNVQAGKVESGGNKIGLDGNAETPVMPLGFKTAVADTSASVLEVISSLLFLEVLLPLFISIESTA